MSNESNREKAELLGVSSRTEFVQRNVDTIRVYDFCAAFLHQVQDCGQWSVRLPGGRKVEWNRGTRPHRGQ